MSRVDLNNDMNELTYLENNATCFRWHCGTLNSNQSKECGCVIEFSLSHFTALI